MSNHNTKSNGRSLAQRIPLVTAFCCLLGAFPALTWAHTVSVDATQLSSTGFQLIRLTEPGAGALGIVDGTVVQTFDLLEGTYRFQTGGGHSMTCNLSVTAGGDWEYPTECDPFLAGDGTASLSVLGYPVDLDARPLSVTGILMSNLIGHTILDAEVVQTLRLVPAPFYLVQTALVCDCHFEVDLDGNVQYPTDFDGFLGGRGTDTIVFDGYTVRLDATALSTRHFVLPFSIGLSTTLQDSTVVQSYTLLPAIADGFGFQYLSFASFRWNIDHAGLITYDPAFDPYLLGRGTDTLRIVGYPVEVDATALGPGVFQILRLSIGGLDRSMIQPLTLVPAPFEFLTRGPAIRFPWVLVENGTVDYDPVLDDCVFGRGTNRLTVICDPAVRIVEIDIKPGSDVNPLNVKSRGVVPVAILTTPSFDATTVFPVSICFGSAVNSAARDCTAAHGMGHLEDVDLDGDTDLLLHFEMQETGIEHGDTSACLTGETMAGELIHGCDQIVTVP